MGVPSKQIGWSQEAILLHAVSKQLERLQGIIATSGGGGGGGGGGSQDLQSVLGFGNTTNTPIIINDGDGTTTTLSGNVVKIFDGGGEGIYSPSEMVHYTNIPFAGKLFYTIVGLRFISNDGTTFFSLNYPNVLEGENVIFSYPDKPSGSYILSTIEDVFKIINATSITFNTYANDAAADADATLPSGALYKITGNRQLFQKP